MAKSALPSKRLSITLSGDDSAFFEQAAQQLDSTVSALVCFGLPLARRRVSAALGIDPPSFADKPVSSPQEPRSPKQPPPHVPPPAEPAAARPAAFLPPSDTPKPPKPDSMFQGPDFDLSKSIRTDVYVPRVKVAPWPPVQDDEIDQPRPADIEEMDLCPLHLWFDGERILARADDIASMFKASYDYLISDEVDQEEVIPDDEGTIWLSRVIVGIAKLKSKHPDEVVDPLYNWVMSIMPRQKPDDWRPCVR